MCGIFGVTDKRLDTARACEACNLLEHRGPNSMMYWENMETYVGQTRLSINDLSPNGNQPFVVVGKIVVAVNGEIYNYHQLKEELVGKYTFKSGSDSEIVVHGFLEWGIDKLIKKLDGMYAISIYDMRDNKIYLIRDRVGIKPLYYSSINEKLVWASELKSISKYINNSELSIDNTALYDFLTYLYIPTPKTIYNEVKKLEPGYYIEYEISTGNLINRKYWELATDEIDKPIDQVLMNVKKILGDAVQSHLLSDIPVGSFLSGGIDSSIVTYEASSRIKHLKTYTIGFAEKTHDESDYAKELAKSIEVENILSIMNKSFMTDMTEEILKYFDEPFGDSSMFPTYFLSKITKKYSTVVLSGDGGDEVFGGYSRYIGFEELMKKRKVIPKSNLVKYFIGSTNKYVKKIFRRLYKYLKLDDLEFYTIMIGGMISEEKVKYKKIFNISDNYDDYWYFRKYYKKDLSVKKRLQYLDFKTYLPDDILTKVDRTSMKCSLEVRVPLLSKELIEYMFSLPENQVYYNETLKGLLVENYKGKIPDSILYRKKMGFSIPQKKWRKEYLNDYSTWQERVLNDYYIKENIYQV